MRGRTIGNEAGTLASGVRLGNNRTLCRTCNWFAQALRRTAYRELVAAHPDEYAQIRQRAERDLYPAVIERLYPAEPELADR